MHNCYLKVTYVQSAATNKPLTFDYIYLPNINQT